MPLHKQQNFYSFQQYFTGYPDELITKVHSQVTYDYNYTIIRYGQNKQELTFPNTSTVPASYNPGSPDFDPVPNPLVGAASTSETTINLPGGTGPLPRYHTDSPYTPGTGAFYDHWENGTEGYVPTKGEVWQMPGFQTVAYSAEVSVVNNEGTVLNIATGLDEHYPYQQANTVYKADGKIKIDIGTPYEVCCWNDGTVIKGKLKIMSASLTGIPSPGYGSYGYHGIQVTIGSTFSEESTIDWELTINDAMAGFVADIPRMANKVTFAGDFWVTEVIPPT